MRLSIGDFDINKTQILHNCLKNHSSNSAHTKATIDHFLDKNDLNSWELNEQGWNINKYYIIVSKIISEIALKILPETVPEIQKWIITLSLFIIN